MIPDATEENDPPLTRPSTEKPGTPHRDDFHHWLEIPTRWMDNDNYGHVNNVHYYSFFDTVVNEYLIRHGGLDPANSHVIGLVVETHCQFYSGLSFPDIVEAGLRIARIGRSSVRYEIGIFRLGSSEPSANGHFIHVFVDRDNRRPVEIPNTLRAALAPLARRH